MTLRYGIEKIGVYPGMLALDIQALCEARGLDFAVVQRSLMTDERTVLGPWEDAVTMAVNAADGLLSEDERQTVELLIVGTETAVDQEKSVSTWVHRWLGLPSSCRNFELKHACYSGTAAMRMALAWLREQEGRPCRALVVSTDASLPFIGAAHEPTMGACAAAVVLSSRPDFLVPDVARWGVFASEVSDLFRPALGVEAGDAEASLFAYLEALEGSFADFARRSGADIDLDTAFDWHVYHLPFAGMGLRAHRNLTAFAGGLDRRQAHDSYLRKVAPSLDYSRRIGSSFGASIILALLSLLDRDDGAVAGDRLGIFSYGSGSCGEYYEAVFGPHARRVAADAGLRRRLDARMKLTVAEYEVCERQRVQAMGRRDFVPISGAVGERLAERYAGTALLVLDRIDKYYRHYRRA